MHNQSQTKLVKLRWRAVENLIFIGVVGVAAVMGVSLGALASYTARIRDESEQTGKPIEQLYSKHALAAEVIIAAFIGLAGCVIAFVTARRYLSLTDIYEITAISIVVGSLLSFFNRSTILLARQHLPGLIGHWAKNNNNKNAGEG